MPQLFNKFYVRVSTINHNLENDPELILIVDFCNLFAVVQSVSACKSKGNVMLQTATLVVFAATFPIAMNYFKDLTGGCRKIIGTGTYCPLTSFHPKSVGCRSFSSHVST